jgi:membrane protein YqaA with SNARE-associated domain
MSYLGLFVIALLAATLLPAQSEAALVGLLLTGHSAFWLVVFASAGNVLGSTINWWLGREALRFQDRRWFPLSAERLARTQAWYGRYGKWSLLLSWVPIIGDPLTLAAGVMREPLRVFLPLVAVAKVGRYVVLVWVTLRVVGQGPAG